MLKSYSTTNGTKTDELVKAINNLKPSGSTALYPAIIEALNKVKSEDLDKYNVSIIAMTDGQANVGNYQDLKTAYSKLNKNIPVYSIMFGSANEKQLQEIATLTNAKVFDGKQDLIKAFKEVRGYN